MKFDFESKNEDGSPRVFVGMHRPTLYEAGLRASSNPAVAPFRASIYPDRLREFWLSGGFDVPLYQVEGAPK